ncbi:DNA translocase FtsK 4TM domain-containing protein [Anaerotignum sp.]
MAEQKNSKKPAKAPAKAPTVKKTTSGGKSGTKKAEPAAKKETTKVTAQPARFGDSILDEIILLVIIVISIVVFVSLLTDKMGIIGGLISSFFKGILGFSGLLLPVFVIVYCIWMLADEEKRYPMVRACGAALFLLTVASAAQIINPVKAAEGVGFLKRCGTLYGEGAFSNGGLFGGLIGGGLYRILDTLGSVIILLALGIISIVMATGKSFFHAIGDANAHRKARKKVKNEKIKNKADRIRQQELLEEERLAKKEERRRKMSREDFNIELQEGDNKETPYVQETVFRKKPLILEPKKREPIFDYVKEKEEEEAGKTAAVKAEAAKMAASALKETAKAKAEEIIPEVKEKEPVIQGVGLEDGDALIEEIFAEKPETKDRPIIDILPEEDMGKEIEEETVAGEIPVVIEEMEEHAPAYEEPAEEREEEPLAAEEAPEEGKTATEETKTETMAAIPAEPVEEEKPYVYPPIDLLGKDPQTGSSGNRSEMIENARKLESTLKSFGVDAKVIQISKGPTVTRYELSPSQGVKVSKIVNLADDIALNLAASGIRIEAPIPGKAAVGIEVPNKETQSVYMRTLLESDAFKEHPSKLAFALGQDIAGNPVVTDIAKMPHLLIAGATGSGKSVCINTLITSILYKADPKEVKLLLVDPKVVELSVYNGIPHLLIPVVTDPKKASSALNWAVREMLQRYNDFAAHGVRDIKGFNKMMEEKGDEKGKMPQIVIIIDELADLMMAAPGEVEDAICRLAQMARAAGMHLIIATQRPSVDVITGVIKANIPSRLAFAVSSGIDSRTILDMVGAEKLLGKGDMLFYPSGQSKPSRLQGAFVTDQEVEAIVDFLKETSKPYYTQETIDQITSAGKAGGGAAEDSDEFFGQAVELILEKEKASVSMLQRQFRIGYNRAARLMDDLEKHGIVGPEEGSKPRKVLITKSQWEEMTGAVPEEI